MAQYVFLVPQFKECQSPVFVIFMSKNLCTNLYCRLRRVNVRYQGKISLHFDLASLSYLRQYAVSCRLLNICVVWTSLKTFRLGDMALFACPDDR